MTEFTKGAAPPLACIVCGLACSSHPILGALGGWALCKNAVGVMSGETTRYEALHNLGSHAVATAASLAVPFAPVVGYIGGGVAGGVVMDRVQPFLRRPVPFAGGRPVWQVALAGLLAAGIGYGLTRR